MCNLVYIEELVNVDEKCSTKSRYRTLLLSKTTRSRGVLPNRGYTGMCRGIGSLRFSILKQGIIFHSFDILFPLVS